MNDIDIFYVCYGSNMSENRFREYLSSAHFRSSKSADFGVQADRAAMLASRKLTSYRVSLPHEVFYAGSSYRWKGGIAYLDVDKRTRPCSYRAYGITGHEFESLFSDENGFHSDPLPWDEVLENRDTYTSAYFYSRVVNLGKIDGVPALTFTTATPRSSFAPATSTVKYGKLNPPGKPYIDVMNTGRAEMRSLPYREIAPSN